MEPDMDPDLAMNVLDVSEVSIDESENASIKKPRRKGASRRTRFTRPKERGKYMKSKKELSPDIEQDLAASVGSEDIVTETNSPSLEKVVSVEISDENQMNSTLEEKQSSDSAQGMLGESTEGQSPPDSGGSFKPEHSYAAPAFQKSATAETEHVGMETSGEPPKLTPKKSKSDSFTGVCSSNEILNEALDLVQRLVPDNWIVLADKKGFHFLLLSNTPVKAIQREIFMKYNGSVSVLIHCKELPPDHEVFNNAEDPAPFKNDQYQKFCQRGLILCWELEKYETCAGADFEEARDIWHSMPNTYIDLNPYMEAVYDTSCRSNECHRLINPAAKTFRCPECTKVLKSMKKRHKSATAEPHESTPNVHLTQGQAQAKLKLVQEKYRKSQKQVDYLKTKMENLEKILEEEGVYIEENASKYFANILEKSNLTEMQKIFLEQQFSYATVSNPKAHRWHPAMIRLAIKIKSASTSAYEALRDSGAVSLPHSRTLFDYTHYIKATVGVNKELLKMLVEEVNKQDDPEYQFHALIFDEMHISQNLIYRKSDGALMGYAHLDQVDEEIRKFECYVEGNQELGDPPLATTMLAFMVKGLTSNVKCVVASYPCKDLNKNMISTRVWEVISLCEGAGIKILAVVCDGSANNRAFFKLHKPLTPTESGIVFDTLNIFSEDERPLFFIADVAHLLKTIRNCFYNSREGEGDRFRCLTVNNQKLLWKIIVRLYYSERGDTLREAFKLNSQNVFPNSYSTMRVKYAAQVLSTTVANALAKKKWAECEETINFIRKIDKFFDCLNGAHSSQHIRQLKPDLAPYDSLDDPRFDWLQEEFWNGYLLKWKEDNKKLGLSATELGKSMLSYQTLEGIEISIRGFTAATKWLLTEGNASFVMARAFSQDPLEQHYSIQRGNVGGSTNPNVVQFMQTQISVALQGKLKTKRRKANVEDDGAPSLASSETLPKLKRKRRKLF